MSDQAKHTLIAVLASHDDSTKHAELKYALESFHARYKDRNLEDEEKFDAYHFVFTGGTFDRLVLGLSAPSDSDQIVRVDDPTRDWLLERSTRLPSYRDGGIILLTCLVIRRVISIVWTFLTPLTSHWLNPEDQALHRLCNVWRAKCLMNKGSVLEWLNAEVFRDYDRNPRALPVSDHLDELSISAKNEDGHWRIEGPEIVSEFVHLKDKPWEKRTIALIAHDELKPRMAEFATDHETELMRFGRILTTRTTGAMIELQSDELASRTLRCQSGPRGGDVEIAAHVLYGRCDAVVFFLDPLHPHPHTQDILVIRGACMRNPHVHMLANESHAREWVKRVVRRWPL